MSNNPNPKQTEPLNVPSMDVQTAQRVEQEKMTRRAALRKLGFGAGMAAFALLGVDDLARMVGQRMERMAGDNKVAGQIAREFQSVGIALANPTPSSGGPCGCNGDCTCLCNCTKTAQIAAACAKYSGCCDANNVPKGTCVGGFSIDVGNAETAATNCVAGCPT